MLLALNIEIHQFSFSSTLLLLKLQSCKLNVKPYTNYSMRSARYFLNIRKTENNSEDFFLHSPFRHVVYADNCDPIDCFIGFSLFSTLQTLHKRATRFSWHELLIFHHCQVIRNKFHHFSALDEEKMCQKFINRWVIRGNCIVCVRLCVCTGLFSTNLTSIVRLQWRNKSFSFCCKLFVFALIS